MAPVRLAERDAIRAFWRGHSEAWKLSGLPQRAYCEQHGISLKSFGNWRAQLKREALAGAEARWGRHPRLRPRSGPSSRPMTKEEPADVIPPRGGRREFSEELKQRIVEETCKPGASVSAVARRYRITTSLLFRWRSALGVEPLPQRARFLSVQVSDAAASHEPAAPPAVPPSTPLIVERPAPGVEIELIGGRKVRFDRDTDPETMKRVVAMLEGAAP
jgi:transposase